MKEKKGSGERDKQDVSLQNILFVFLFALAVAKYVSFFNF